MRENKSGSSPRAALSRNPALILFLGACPAMALTASVLPALGIGIATLLVMLLSNLVICALRSVIGDGFVAKVVVISFFASAAGMLMNAFLPDIYRLMGVYIAVLAVSLVAFRSAEETVASGFGRAIADALVTGLVFTAALFCMAAVREIFGSASFAGQSIAFLKNYTVPILAQAPGGFIVFAILLAVLNRFSPAAGGTDHACTACAAAGADGACEN